MKYDTEHPTRRTVVQGAAAGLVGTLAAPALASAQSADAGGTSAGKASLTNPKTDYAQPPFHSEEQPWPGLASRMTPKPDHGEATYRGSGKLSGRKALITGGDSGIGRAAAIAYAREGADVAINYLPAEEPDAREVIALIEQAGRKAVALPGDIRDEAFCRRLVANAVKALGGLDILVNNAGRQHHHESILELTTEDFDWTFKTNVYAMFWITKAAVPHLPPGAAIVNTASVNAYDPSPALLDYAATKAAIANFSKGLAKQLAAQGIRVNAVAPGPFWTALQVSGGQSMANVEKFGAETPLGRPGQPAEIAPIYVQLAAADATYITGQVYGAAGGAGNP